MEAGAHRGVADSMGKWLPAAEGGRHTDGRETARSVGVGAGGSGQGRLQTASCGDVKLHMGSIARNADGGY